MKQYIERARVTDALIDNTSLKGSDLEEAVNAICNIPAADVREVVGGGKWEYEEQEVGDANGGVGTIWGYRCPRCDTLNVYKSNFCPNCGADMREES